MKAEAIQKVKDGEDEETEEADGKEKRYVTVCGGAKQRQYKK